MLIKIDGRFVYYFLEIIVVSSVELSSRFEWFRKALHKKLIRKLKLCYSCLNYDKNNPADTGRKLYVLCTFNLRPMSTGKDELTETLQPLHPIRTMPVLSSSVGNKMCFSSTFFSNGGTALIHGRIYFGNSGQNNNHTKCGEWCELKLNLKDRDLTLSRFSLLQNYFCHKVVLDV